MTPSEIVEVLGYANGADLMVRLLLVDGSTVTGIPTSVDLHPTAHEVFLRPLGAEDTEIAVSLGAVAAAELV